MRRRETAKTLHNFYSVFVMDLSPLEEVVIARKALDDEHEIRTQTSPERSFETFNVHATPQDRQAVQSTPHASTRHIFLSFTLICLASTLTTVLLFWPHAFFLRVRLWRGMLFLTLVIPCHYAASVVTRCISNIIDYSFSVTRKLLYFWIDVSSPFRRWLRMCLCVLSFGVAVAPRDTGVFDYGARVLVCGVVYTSVNLVRTVAGKVLAFRYHSDQHFNLVETSLRKEYLLRKLCKPSNLSHESASQDRCIAEHMTAPTPPLQQDARDVAAQLFNKLKHSGRTYLIMDDLRYKVASEEVSDTFHMLDLNDNGRVTLNEIVSAVERIYEDREKLSDMLRDTNDIVVHLKDIIGAVLHVMCVFVYLVIFKMDVSKVYVSFSSLVVVWSLVFAASIRNVYESVIFLFGVHPFDCGDVLNINGEILTVKRMGLNTCVFVKTDNSLVWYPNSKLASLPLINVSRSGSKTDRFEIYITCSVTHTMLEDLRHACLRYLVREPKEYKQRCQCYLVDVKDSDKLLLSVEWETAFCQCDIARFAKARHGLYMVIARELERMGLAFSNSHHLHMTSSTSPSTTSTSDNIVD